MTFTLSFSGEIPCEVDPKKKDEENPLDKIEDIEDYDEE